MDKNNRHKKVSGLEHRFRRAVANLRHTRNAKKYTTDDVVRDLEISIAHTIRRINQYGFEFFANHYIRDDVIALEGMANQMRTYTQPR